MTITGTSILIRDPNVTVTTAPYSPRGPVIAGTSDGTVVVTTGPVVFEMNEYALGFLPGMRLRASAIGAPINWLEGICTSYDNTTQLLAITVDLTGGSGTYNSWQITVAGEQGQVGPAGPTGAPGFPDAPLDSNKYARLNGAWTNISTDLAGYQPLDSDLTAIAALTGTNTIYYRSGAGVWSPVTMGSGMAFAGGVLTASSTGGNVSNSGTPVAGQLAVWTGTQNIQGLDGNFGHGRFDFVSTTACKFAPYFGSLIKVNGVLYPIPTAGIAGLANTSVYVNGVAGQNLAANTTYWVFAFNNAGTITGDFRTAATHATSATAGNVGTEILTADDTRTLIGLVRTNAASQFQNDGANRLVISWFNRLAVALNGSGYTGSTTSTSPVEITPTSGRCNFVTWGNEGLMTFANGIVSNSIGGAFSNANVYLDGTTATWVRASAMQAYVSNGGGNIGGVGSIQPSEGFHYITLFGWSGSGNSTFGVNIGGMIRG